MRIHKEGTTRTLGVQLIEAICNPTAGSESH